MLKNVKAHGFHVLSLEPQIKDGGVFVKFEYSAGEQESALDTIVQELRKTSSAQGGMPSWWGLHTGDVWLVKGRPWKEACNILLWKLIVSELPIGYEPLRIPYSQNRLRWA